MNSSRRESLLTYALWVLSAALSLTGCQATPNPEVTWALVLPDSAVSTAPGAQAWLSAAAEEGFALKALRDSDLMRPWADLRERHPVLIFPDGLHNESPPMVMEKLRTQLEQGDSVVIASDAFSKDFPGGALGALCEKKTASSAFVYKSARFGAISSPLELTDEGAELKSILTPGAWATAPDGRDRWVGYQAAEKNLAHSITAGKFPGRVLASDANGETLLGVEACGAGKIFFANLPLTYLKSRTDGAMMHALLKLVDRESTPSARLLPTPDGIGGFVLNIHVDSNAAIEPLKRLDRQGFFGYGPFSVHVTAGPDARTIGDHLGFDVDNRPEGKQFLARLTAQGHAIGSHGGWIHDFFGRNLPDTPQEPFISYLKLNLESLQRATGKAVTEYSAPMGNHPAWVTTWLEQHGVIAYYTTGNTGLGPTHSYLDGSRLETTSWAFPVNTLGTWASLEEFHEHGYAKTEVARWLKELSVFAADSREIRLFYSHPPGLEEYSAEILEWLHETQKLQAQGRFKWYVMSEVAKFLTRREQSSWNETIDPQGAHGFEAKAPIARESTLESLTWCLPKSRYRKPEVDVQQVTLTQDSRCWLVRAGKIRETRFRAFAIDSGSSLAQLPKH